MIAPGGNEQESLTGRIPAIAVALEKEPPDCFAARRSSRLARRPCRDPRSFKRCHEKPDLGRLACALAALDRDKPAARSQFRPLGVQCR